MYPKSINTNTKIIRIVRGTSLSSCTSSCWFRNGIYSATTSTRKIMEILSSSTITPPFIIGKFIKHSNKSYFTMLFALCKAKMYFLVLVNFISRFFGYYSNSIHDKADYNVFMEHTVLCYIFIAHIYI